MKLNAASLKKLEKVKPDMVRLVHRAAEITEQPFQIVQGNRTQAEQNALYAQGRGGKKGPIVTWTKNSKHIGGGAIDFAALVDGKISWNEKFYPVIAKAFKEAARELGIGIQWGGDWRTKDWGHVELTGKAAVGVKASAEAKVDLTPPGTRPVLKRGSKGGDVFELQRLLGGIPVDGDFGPLTEAHVRAVQAGRGLRQDGIVGPATWASLEGKPASVPPLDNPAAGMKRLLGLHGWPKHHAAAFIGRAQQESFKDIRTGVEGDKEEKTGSAHGAWQWRMDRKEALKQFAAHKGKPWTDWDTQVDFMVHELATSERRAGELLKKAGTLEQAVEAAMAYCRPAGFTWSNPRAGHGWSNTLRNATELMAKDY